MSILLSCQIFSPGELLPFWGILLHSLGGRRNDYIDPSVDGATL